MSHEDTGSHPEEAFIKDQFLARFSNEQKSLQSRVENLKNTSLSSSERQNLTDRCLSSISELSNSVNDASHHLPVYDQRTCSTTIKSLTQNLQSARSASAPKRKFAFKSIAPDSSGRPAGNLPASSTAQTSRSPYTGREDLDVLRKNGLNEPSFNSISHGETLTVSLLSYGYYVLNADALRPAASITAIIHSLIDLSISSTTNRPFSTLAIENVTESLLICGQISGAAHITGVKHSTLILRSRQVRLHECEDCVVYLHCSSRPIIEDCHRVRFAPLPASFNLYSGEAPESAPPNLWDQVDDFKWLRAEHSPNWSVLQPQDERAIDDEGWGKIATSNGVQRNLDNLLKAAKVNV